MKRPACQSPRNDQRIEGENVNHLDCIQEEVGYSSSTKKQQRTIRAMISPLHHVKEEEEMKNPFDVLPNELFISNNHIICHLSGMWSAKVSASSGA